MEELPRISRRKRRLRSLDEPQPWEPRHMKLSGVRLAESVGGEPGARRNLTLGVIKHLWRSPVPFLAFYPPEGVKVTESRTYSPAPPRYVDDAEYLVGVEAHKEEFAKDLREAMIPSGRNLAGYFEIPTDEGWRFGLDLVESRLELADPWGIESEAKLSGDVAPFVWAYRHSGFCVISLYDKDIDALRDDLLFVAKREGISLKWREKAA